MSGVGAAMFKEITYEIDGRAYTGYLTDGSCGKPAAGILVLHGAGGLGSQAKQRAEMLAKLGYVAFAPDLFGETVHGVERAKAVARVFTDNWALLRLRCAKAMEVLCDEPNVDRERLAAVGFCFGGQAALELGRSGAALRAIVGFHSQLETRRPEDSVSIKAKVLVCLGDRDCFVSREDRDAFMDNMTASNVDCQLLLLAGIGHSFTDPFAERSGIPGLKYDARADRRAWAAMQALFAEAFDDAGSPAPLAEHAP